VIEHTPWVQAPIRIPKSIEDMVRQMLLEQKAAGKYEHPINQEFSLLASLKEESVW